MQQTILYMAGHALFLLIASETEIDINMQALLLGSERLSTGCIACMGLRLSKIINTLRVCIYNLLLKFGQLENREMMM